MIIVYYLLILLQFPAYHHYNIYWKFWKVGEMRVNYKERGDTLDILLSLETTGMWKKFYRFEEEWNIKGDTKFYPYFINQTYVHGKKSGKWIYDFFDDVVVVDKKDTLKTDRKLRDVFSTLFSLSYSIPDTIKLIHHKKIYSFIPNIENKKSSRKVTIKGRRSVYGITYNKKTRKIDEMVISTSWGILKAKSVKEDK